VFPKKLKGRFWKSSWENETDRLQWESELREDDGLKSCKPAICKLIAQIIKKKDTARESPKRKKKIRNYK
jgi:hypothetical protein